MKEIQLTQGKVALVDDADYEMVSQYKWQAAKCGHSWYARGTVAGQGTWMHRFILRPPGSAPIDHCDGDGLNNCRRNIRVCTKQENARNTRKDTTSKAPYKGIAPVRGKWRARLHVEGKKDHLGLFDTPEEAARAYDQAAIREFGEFARINGV